MVDIRKLIEKQKSFYNSVVSVPCPILGDVVYFRADGFSHLIEKSNNKRRPIPEQILKLKCVEHAPEIVKNCTRIIETRQEKVLIKGKQKQATMYELVDGEKRDFNIAVIVRKIGSTGKLKFRSVKRISDTRYGRK